ncbi:MAG: hypothetical protein EKK41_12510 [Hyphomicrobiales bacterium]|nr:MAG: hypothetical protein EKK41_12510 [Hyphomicrobiales bacterium]
MALPQPRTLAFLAMPTLMALGMTSASAALAPAYERVRQLSAVMGVASEAAGLLYSTGPIDKIEAIDALTYRIWAKRCFVPVTLRIERPPADQPPMPGAPTQYRPELGKMVCP